MKPVIGILQTILNVATIRAIELGRELTPDLLTLVLLEDDSIATLSNLKDLAGKYKIFLLANTKEVVFHSIAMDERISEIDDSNMKRPIDLLRLLIASNDLAPLTFKFFSKLGKNSINLEVNTDLIGYGKLFSKENVVLLPYCTELTNVVRESKDFSRAIGREVELRKIMGFLLQPMYNNSLSLVGPVGVGKACIINEIAYLLISENCPEYLKGAKLLEIDLDKFLIGATRRFQLTEKVQELIEVTRNAKNRIIFCIKKLHQVTEEIAIVFDQLLRPVLDGDIQLVVAMDEVSFKKLSARNNEFNVAFPVEKIDEPHGEVIAKILEVLSDQFEKISKVKIDKAAILLIIDLAKRHQVTMGANPLKTIALVNLCVAYALNNNQKTVTKETVYKVVHIRTGVDALNISTTEREKILTLGDKLMERVLGQPVAVNSVVKAIKRRRSGLYDDDSPGSFIFLGTTGVGKTHLAKVLAELLYDDPKALIRIDMSEYMEKHNVARLIGPPPGYEGNSEGGYLTSAVRAKPYSVILLDEIEKAHSDVFNILLQVLDDGRLTDGLGFTADFRDCIIIMTSNIGSEYYDDYDPEGKCQGEEKANLEERIRLALKSQFRPEFLNRIDETVIFHKLSKVDLSSIIEIEFRYGLMRQAAKKGISITISEAAKQFLVDQSYDHSMGARPLIRAINSMVTDKLSEKVFSGQLPDDSRVDIGLDDNGNLEFDISPNDKSKG